jgi:Lon protease-like protein
MWDTEELSFSPEKFSGTVRLFPLPNLVMFPNVMQPLHVFEPRYRELVADALADDQLIAMALLEPGWESDYEGRPQIAPMACLGKIATHCSLEGGKYNLLLLGVRRVRIIEELPPKQLYRQARVELCEDRCDASPARQAELQRELLAAFKRLLPRVPDAAEQLDELLAKQVPLGMLTDIVSYTLDFDLALKQHLLGELCVERRAEWLIDRLPSLLEPAAVAHACGFPPHFSAN